MNSPLKPTIVIEAVANGYIITAVHPDTSMEVGKRVATTSASAYSADCLQQNVEKLLEIDCNKAADEELIGFPTPDINSEPVPYTANTTYTVVAAESID